MKTEINTNLFELNSRYLLPLMMLYLMATLAADVVAYKFVAIGPLIESGATLIFPFTYLIGDVVTEVYGYHIARKFIWLNLICELIFALLVIGIIHLESPAHMNSQAAFILSLGNLLRFVLSGVLGNICSDFLNVYLISSWKILTRGKLFWLRSLVSTALSELVLILITGFSAFTGAVHFNDVLKIAGSAYLMEIFYALIFVWPSWALIIFLKNAEGLDVYDHQINYNPFYY